MNKFSILFLLINLLQISSTFTLENQKKSKKLPNKYNKIAYILPITKIIIGITQSTSMVVAHNKFVKKKSCLKFFNTFRKRLFCLNLSTTLETLCYDVIPYVTSAFLINSGIQDLKKLKNKNLPTIKI